jgi:hypothetical protein
VLAAHPEARAVVNEPLFSFDDARAEEWLKR